MTERNLSQIKLSLDPRALSLVGRAFDDSWAAIASHYTESEIEDARTRLATVILGLAADRSRDGEQLKAAAMAFFNRARSAADVLH